MRIENKYMSTNNEIKKENNYKISIIVPIFNSQRYIEKCVKTIITQNYNNIEIILVNDGSTDNSPEICNQLSYIDERIKVIHKLNEGSSEARNTGIKVATGDFLLFIDSDDYVEKTLITKLINRLFVDSFDIVIFGFFVDYVDKNEKITRFKKVYNKYDFTNTKSIQNITFNTDFFNIIGYAWNKLYRKSFLNDHMIRFEKDALLCEDLVFNTLALTNTKKIASVRDPLVHYIQRQKESLGKMIYNNHFTYKLKALSAKKQLLEHWNISNNKKNKILNYQFYLSLKNTLTAISTFDNISIVNRTKMIRDLLNNDKVQQHLNKTKKHYLSHFVLFCLVKAKMITFIILFSQIYCKLKILLNKLTTKIIIGK